MPEEKKYKLAPAFINAPADKDYLIAGSGHLWLRKRDPGTGNITVDGQPTGGENHVKNRNICVVYKDKFIVV